MSCVRLFPLNISIECLRPWLLFSDVVRKTSKTSTDQQSSQKSNGGKGRDEDDVSDPTSMTSPRGSTNREMGPSFYIGGANGVAL